jgi:hypothetical protein
VYDAEKRKAMKEHRYLRREYWILCALRDNGGLMLTSQVYLKVREMREKTNDPLSPEELKLTRKPPKEEKWKNRIRHASRALVDDKRMRRASQGVWEITEKGIKWLEAHKWLVVPGDPSDLSDM